MPNAALSAIATVRGLKGRKNRSTDPSGVSAVIVAVTISGGIMDTAPKVTVENPMPGGGLTKSKTRFPSGVSSAETGWLKLNVGGEGQ